MRPSALTLADPLPQPLTSPGESLTRGKRWVAERRGQPVEGRGPKSVAMPKPDSPATHGPR